MNAVIRQQVVQRAGNRCEYCRIHQDDDVVRLHVDHVIPRQHHGSGAAANLALSCRHCNLHKGPNLSAIDPETKTVVALFNPRTQNWADHFLVMQDQIVGLTPTGRATVYLLNMNNDDRVDLRRSVLGG